MSRRLVALLLSSLVAGLAVVWASSPGAAELLPLVRWIDAHSDELSYDGRPMPHLQTIQAEDLDALGGYFVGSEVYAVYDEGAILVSDRLDLDASTTTAILVHELVHWLQDVDGIRDEECVARNEPLAYRVQREWAEAHGVETDTSGAFDALTIVMFDCDMGGYP